MVQLKHTIHSADEKVVYFYDGQLTAKDGVLEIPSDKPEWIRRAWVLGYRLDPKKKTNVRIEEILDLPVGE